MYTVINISFAFNHQLINDNVCVCERERGLSTGQSLDIVILVTVDLP